MSANTKPRDRPEFCDGRHRSQTGSGGFLVRAVVVGPALEELAGEFGDKLTVAEVDIDSDPMSPTNYAVRGIPTLILV